MGKDELRSKGGDWREVGIAVGLSGSRRSCHNQQRMANWRKAGGGGGGEDARSGEQAIFFRTVELTQRYPPDW